MDRPSGLPLEIFFEHNLRIDGGNVLVQLPSGWHALKEEGKQPIFNAKIRILSVIAKQDIPEALKNHTLLVTIDELPPISLLFSDPTHGISSTASVLTSIYIHQKRQGDQLKIRLINNGQYPLWPNRPVRKLSLGLRSFPHDSSIGDITLRLQFHLQLFDFSTKL